MAAVPLNQMMALLSDVVGEPTEEHLSRVLWTTGQAIRNLGR